MKNFVNRILQRKQSTQRVDDMANGMARAALDRRLNQMLALHASQPVPPPRHFELLVKPEANDAKV